MKAPSLPANEAERLADLYDYGILDTPAEKIFDEVAQLAATICGTRFAAVTLIDRDRQWFKAEHGLHFGETPRDHSICGHAILESELFVVPDTQADGRFADNPLLRGNPTIRFYGGSRLVSDRGNALGMLCVMHPLPHELSAEQRKALAQLADVLMAVMNAGRATRLTSWFGTLLDNVQDEILIINPRTLVYLHANRAAQEHLGYSLEEMRRLTPMDVTDDHDRAKFERFVARLEAGEPFVTFAGVRNRADESTYPVEARWQLLKTADRTVILSIVQDVTGRREAEAMKDEFIARVSRELEIARAMQRGLLPPPGMVQGLDAAWFFQASSFVGGDAFDYLPVDDSHVCFYMLDVAGHGVPAAMMALSAQHQLNGLARRNGTEMLAQGRSIADTAVTIVTEYNRRTLEYRDWDLFVTLVLGIYDAKTHRAAIVQAGHPPALAMRAGMRSFTETGAGALPIGISANPAYEAQVVDVPPGSRIVLYSDGVVECLNFRTAEFGNERLAHFLQATHGKPIADVARTLGEELAEWHGGASFEDDVTFVILETA